MMHSQCAYNVVRCNATLLKSAFNSSGVSTGVSQNIFHVFVAFLVVIKISGKTKVHLAHICRKVWESKGPQPCAHPHFGGVVSGLIWGCFYLEGETIHETSR